MPCLSCNQVFEPGEPFYLLQDGMLKVCLKCEAMAKADIERLDGVPFGSYPFKKPCQAIVKGKDKLLMNQVYKKVEKRNYDRLRKLPGEVVIIKKGKPSLKEKGRKLKGAARRIPQAALR